MGLVSLRSILVHLFRASSSAPGGMYVVSQLPNQPCRHQCSSSWSRQDPRTKAESNRPANKRHILTNLLIITHFLVITHFLQSPQTRRNTQMRTRRLNERNFIIILLQLRCPAGRHTTDLLKLSLTIRMHFGQPRGESECRHRSSLTLLGCQEKKE